MSHLDDIDPLPPMPDPDRLERYHRQQLSAMLDGELGQEPARFLRRRLAHDADLSARFERWQLTGDVLRGRQVSLLPADFADRVADAIADSPVAAEPARSARSARGHRLRWGGGAALAASVALAALFAGRPAVEVEVAPADAVAQQRGSLLPAPGRPEPAAAEPAEGVSAAAVEAVGGDAAVAVSEAAAPSRREAGAVSTPRPMDAPRVARVERPASGAAHRSASPETADSRVAVLVAPGDTDALPAAMAPARPWPKASPLTANSSFSVRYGDRFEVPAWGIEAPSQNLLPGFGLETRPQPASSQPRFQSGH